MLAGSQRRAARRARKHTLCRRAAYKRTRGQGRPRRDRCGIRRRKQLQGEFALSATQVPPARPLVSFLAPVLEQCCDGESTP